MLALMLQHRVILTLRKDAHDVEVLLEEGEILDHAVCLVFQRSIENPHQKKVARRDPSL